MDLFDLFRKREMPTEEENANENANEKDEVFTPRPFLLFVVAFVVLGCADAENSTQECADAEDCFWDGIGIRQPPDLTESGIQRSKCRKNYDG